MQGGVARLVAELVVVVLEDGGDRLGLASAVTAGVQHVHDPLLAAGVHGAVIAAGLGRRCG